MFQLCHDRVNWHIIIVYFVLDNSVLLKDLNGTGPKLEVVLTPKRQKCFSAIEYDPSDKTICLNPSVGVKPSLRLYHKPLSITLADTLMSHFLARSPHKQPSVVR